MSKPLNNKKPLVSGRYIKFPFVICSDDPRYMVSKVAPAMLKETMFDTIAVNIKDFLQIAIGAPVFLNSFWGDDGFENRKFFVLYTNVEVAGYDEHRKLVKAANRNLEKRLKRLRDKEIKAVVSVKGED